MRCDAKCASTSHHLQQQQQQQQHNGANDSSRWSSSYCSCSSGRGELSLARVVSEGDGFGVYGCGMEITLCMCLTPHYCVGNPIQRLGRNPTTAAAMETARGDSQRRVLKVSSELRRQDTPT